MPGIEVATITAPIVGPVTLDQANVGEISDEVHEAVGGGPEEKELIIQGVRFAFRVHQFNGGFDVETIKAFQELRDKARSCHVQYQSQIMSFC
ncbi:hypothetical protein V6N13_130337 [Hibiscus sabdariffa]|uniref:Uncharacterized protein n=1 Tax=Hibiscus sabdariffa TaxID=183260 RepID=A0ABR2AQU5_9ROSI